MATETKSKNNAIKFKTNKQKTPKRTKQGYKLIVQIHTALKDKERVCKMSSMVFKTRPLQRR